MLAFSEIQNPEGTPQSAWGILKSPDKGSNLRRQDPNLARTNQDPTPADKNDGMRFSRVSFRLENEVFGGDELEAEADSEVKAITGTDGESPGVEDEVRFSALLFSSSVIADGIIILTFSLSLIGLLVGRKGEHDF